MLALTLGSGRAWLGGMKRFLLAFLMVSGLCHAEGILVDHACVDAQDTVIPAEDLGRARGLKVLFGHQSVGNNLIAGLAVLGRNHPERYGWRIQAQPNLAWFQGGGGLGHFPVGRNGDGPGKVRDFVRWMDTLGYGAAVDVAMMKLCFVDLQGPAGSDAPGLFQAYREGMESLEQAHPTVRLVWWTQPLVKQGNRVRNEFNQMVREHCRSQGKCFFDFADLESHDPAGVESTDGAGPCLFSGYTRDGGHLTEEGSVRMARAWWWLLARIAGWQGA